MRKSSLGEWLATIAGALLVYATLPLAAVVWSIGKLSGAMRRGVFWLILFVALPLAYAGVWLFRPADGERAPVDLEVRTGTTFKVFTDSLVNHGVVTRPLLFRLAARVSGIDRQLHVGLYRFSPGHPPFLILRQLAKHDQLYQRFTVREGGTLKEFIPEIAADLGLPADSLWNEAENVRRFARLGIQTPRLEGYLFPETYTVRWGAPAAEILDAMVAQFESVWHEVSAHYTGPLDRHEAVTLASMIEAEAMAGRERRLISSVFHNRLRKRMRLQCDPTVIYAMGGLDRPLMRKDWEYDSPYNTYRVAGLPPGPIGAPGRAALEAALHPETTDFLYFVARGDGTHEFSRTLAEHEAAFRHFKRNSKPSH